MVGLNVVLFSVVNGGAIDGKPRVIDGDTIEIAGERIRLHGIDAPEAKQTCERAGEQTFALAARIENHWIECDARDRDRYGRIIAVCMVGGPNGIDLNRGMVAEGWAVAYRRYSLDYADAGAEAREGRRGIWSGKFTEPEQWRRDKR